MKKVLVTATLFVVLATGTSLAQTPVSSEFTYQGQLKEGGMPYNGTATLRFQLYDAETGGMLIGSDSKPEVSVNNGLFTVTLDFGSEAFTGDARWLEIAVYEMGVGYVTLTPRQPLRASPYALYALNGGGGGSLWSQNGNDIYYAAGDVGVGTVNPLYPLHVSGCGSTTAYTQNSATGGMALYANATGTTGRGIYAQATSGTGVTYGVEAYVQSPNGFALYGFNESDSGSANAVRGECGSPDGVAIFGWAGNDSGMGTTIGVKGRIDNPSGAALYGEAAAPTGTSSGVYGESASPDGKGVVGVAGSWDPGDGVGVYGESFGWDGAGVHGRMSNEYGLGVGVKGEKGGSTGYLGHDFGGVYGASSNADGVTGFSSNARGVAGSSANGVAGRFDITNAENNSNALEVFTAGDGYGIHAENTSPAPSFRAAIYGKHTVSDGWGVGVEGRGYYVGVGGTAVGSGSYMYQGVVGQCGGTGAGICIGVHGTAFGSGTNWGLYGEAFNGATNYAGYFSGNVHVSGTLSKGGGSFKIDHPLDPESKYLLHSFVESPDMMNVYNGNVTLDADGAAVVTLPEWFEALNRDFRYQLTPIGGPGPDLHVAQEITGNHFKIAGGRPSLIVSWQVTGIRHDPFAEAYRIPVEQNKSAEERGTYLHPEARGLPAELQVDRVLKARSEAARREALVTTVEQAQEPSLPGPD